MASSADVAGDAFSFGFWPRGTQLGVPLLVSTLAINLLGLALPLAVLQVYDRVLAQRAESSWHLTVAVVLAAAALEAFLRLLRTALTGWHGTVQEQRMTTAFLRHLLAVAPGKHGPGENLHMLEALTRLREFSSGQALTVLLELPFIAVYLALVGYLGGMLVLIPLGMLALLLATVKAQGDQLALELVKRDRAEVARKNLLIEILEHIHTVKAFGRQRPMQRRVEAQQHELARAALGVAELTSRTYQSGLLFGEAMLVGVAMAGTPLVLSGYLTLGALMACVLVAGRLMSPVQRAMALYGRVQEARQAVVGLRAVLARPGVFGAAMEAGPLSRAGSLEVSGLGLRHHETGRWLLRQAGFSAECGETLGLDVESDAAGTALLQTLGGLRMADEGRVLLNGLAPHRLASDELVRQVGYLSANGAIYRGTIYDNLSRFGLTPKAAVSEMVELLELEPAISVLSRGYATPLEGTLADPLPPDLKQRLALARVLAMKPRVILFHQADRNLDRPGYNAVYRLLSRLKGQALMLLLTDDQNLRNLCDRRLAQAGSSLKLAPGAGEGRA